MMRATSWPVIRTASPEVVVLDASAMVDLLTGRSAAGPIRLRLRDTAIHVPHGACRAAPGPADND
jgi:hypothetical protein